MKNKILLIVLILIVILLASIYWVYNYRTNALESQKINKQFQSYYDTQMLGTELISIINKTEDVNTKYGIEKDEEGLFIENDINSIKVYVNFKYKDEYRLLEIEKILNNGIENFIKTYSTASFKCTEITYHEKTGNVKALVFEETDD